MSSRTPDYNDALSREVGFFVYDGGIVFFPGFITTLGNVTTNGSGNVGVIEDHEAVHVWQSRVFGPVFQVSYVAWLAGGAVVKGTAVWLTDTDEDWYSLVETAAYYNNPWEVWAYTNDNNWPPGRSEPEAGLEAALIHRFAHLPVVLPRRDRTSLQ